ncbi:hypothetical protein V8E53_007329 [Lactarius tabidus]
MYIPLLLYIEQYFQTCISSIACTPWFGSSHLLYQTLSTCSTCLTHPVLLLNRPSNSYCPPSDKPHLTLDTYQGSQRGYQALHAELEGNMSKGSCDNEEEEDKEDNNGGAPMATNDPPASKDSKDNDLLRSLQWDKLLAWVENHAIEAHGRFMMKKVWDKSSQQKIFCCKPMAE